MSSVFRSGNWGWVTGVGKGWLLNARIQSWVFVKPHCMLSNILQQYCGLWVSEASDCSLIPFSDSPPPHRSSWGLLYARDFQSHPSPTLSHTHIPPRATTLPIGGMPHASSLATRALSGLEKSAPLSFCPLDPEPAIRVSQNNADSSSALQRQPGCLLLESWGQREGIMFPECTPDSVP